MLSNIFLIWFLFSFYFVSLSSSSNVVCDDAEECESDTLSTDDNVYCRGYLACSSATITAGKVAYCMGDYGCKSATIIGKSEVRCQSSYSCQSATISKAGTKMQVYGNEGVRNATVCGDGSTLFYGYGFYSSRYAKIYNMSTIYASGLYGMAYSKIYSTDLSSLTLYAYGTHATYSARLYCYSDSSCTVDCGNYYGCNGLTIYCYSGATCDYSCDDCSTDSCPTETSESMEDFMYAIKQEFGFSKYDEFVKYYDKIVDGYEKLGREKEEYYKKTLYPNDDDKAYKEFNKWFNNYVKEQNEQFFGKLEKWGYYQGSVKSGNNFERDNNVVLDTAVSHTDNGFDDLVVIGLPACIAFVLGMIIHRLCLRLKGRKEYKDLSGYGTVA